MRRLRNFVLPLAALFFVVLCMPQAAQAQAQNCPKEPTQTSIAGGDVFSGSNCSLNAIGDIDSFVFSAEEGQTYHLALSMTGAADSNVCLTLYDPNVKSIYSMCTSSSFGQPASVVVDQPLTVTGTYQINVTEASNTTQGYALSLERLFPFPPNAQTITTLGQTYNGNIAEPTDENAFVFTGVTTGTYQVTAAMTGSALENVCLTVYAPNGMLVSPSGGTTNPGCSSSSFGQDASVVIDFTPSQAGTYMELVQAGGNTGTQTYTMEVSCLVGVCKQPPPPPCTLKDALSYNATTSTLTMNFTVENTSTTTWNAWLTTKNSLTKLFSVTQPVTTSPVVITKTTTLSPSGIAGVLTTLTTAKKGIICSNYTQITTGAP